MDIAAMSILSSQMKSMSKISVAVAKLSMDSVKENANEMTKMLEQSVSPGKGGSIDIKV